MATSSPRRVLTLQLLAGLGLNPNLEGEEMDRGFKRVRLRAGETRAVEFQVPAENLPKQRTRISVGGGQPSPQVAHVEGAL